MRFYELEDIYKIWVSQGPSHNRNVHIIIESNNPKFYLNKIISSLNNNV